MYDTKYQISKRLLALFPVSCAGWGTNSRVHPAGAFLFTVRKLPGCYTGR